MAKHLIEFDDENLGCKHCPYFRNESTSVKGAALYCAKGKRMRKIANGYSNSEGFVPIPDWCELEEVAPKVIEKEVVVEREIPRPTVHYLYPSDTKRALASMVFPGHYMYTLSEKECADIILHNLSQELAMSLINSDCVRLNLSPDDVFWASNLKIAADVRAYSPSSECGGIREFLENTIKEIKKHGRVYHEFSRI